MLATYQELYQGTDLLNQLKLMGLAPEVPAISGNADIEVPISNAYPKDYLTQGYNTIGRVIVYNFEQDE
jgi:hypothetical protein